MLEADDGRLTHVLNQLFPVRNDSHGISTQNVRRSDQHWVADAVTEFRGTFNCLELVPCGLVNVKTVQHAAEFVAVLRSVDRSRGCAQNLSVVFLQWNREVVGDLSTDRDDNAA